MSFISGNYCGAWELCGYNFLLPTLWVGRPQSQAMKHFLLIVVTKHLTACLQVRAHAHSKIKSVVIWAFRLSWRRPLIWCEVCFWALVSLLKCSQVKPPPVQFSLVKKSFPLCDDSTTALSVRVKIATEICVFSLCSSCVRKTAFQCLCQCCLCSKWSGSNRVWPTSFQDASLGQYCFQPQNRGP